MFHLFLYVFTFTGAAAHRVRRPRLRVAARQAHQGGDRRRTRQVRRSTDETLRGAQRIGTESVFIESAQR